MEGDEEEDDCFELHVEEEEMENQNKDEYNSNNNEDPGDAAIMSMDQDFQMNRSLMEGSVKNYVSKVNTLPLDEN
jgi:hypothetical protein